VPCGALHGASRLRGTGRGAPLPGTAALCRGRVAERSAMHRPRQQGGSLSPRGRAPWAAGRRGALAVPDRTSGGERGAYRTLRDGDDAFLYDLYVNLRDSNDSLPHDAWRAPTSAREGWLLCGGGRARSSAESAHLSVLLLAISGCSGRSKTHHAGELPDEARHGATSSGTRLWCGGATLCRGASVYTRCAASGVKRKGGGGQLSF